MEGLMLREGMSLTVGERVEVYFNLHKGGFSIKSLDKRNPDRGKVVAYAPFIQLLRGDFVVSQPTVQKVREQRRKSVCAVVRGTFYKAEPLESYLVEELTEIYFNPYLTDAFIEKENKEPVEHSPFVYFFEKKCAADIPRLFN